MNRIRTGLTVLIIVLAGACGDAGGNGEAMETDTPTVTPPPPAPPAADSVGMGLPAPADPNRPAGSLGAPGEGASIAATIEDAGIRLSRDTVPAGEITVVIDNRSSSPCALELSSQFYGRQRAAPVAPGGSMQMSMVLARAPYYLFCAGGSGAAGGTARRDSVRLVVR
jgi:hypothetical protein